MVVRSAIWYSSGHVYYVEAEINIGTKFLAIKNEESRIAGEMA